ncbi:hypothetical protein CSUI_005048 [Cystoisospora suis]|uniref:Uncharacterized protein n=1 Tax=Cystoisospora suis TaxID=483139 RepID=A0A2C6KYU7_9APIC|nr:hypothetical protein CSUI_005048 [Cystoisospora suis]
MRRTFSDDEQEDDEDEDEGEEQVEEEGAEDEEDEEEESIDQRQGRGKKKRKKTKVKKRDSLQEASAPNGQGDLEAGENKNTGLQEGSQNKLQANGSSMMMLGEKEEGEREKNEATAGQGEEEQEREGMSLHASSSPLGHRLSEDEATQNEREGKSRKFLVGINDILCTLQLHGGSLGSLIAYGIRSGGSFDNHLS